MGRHWLIRLCRLQVYISMIHDLYIALCAHHPKSNHLPSSYIWSSLPFTTPSLSSGNCYTLVSMSFFVCFFLFSCSFVTFSFLYPTYESIHMILNFLWLLLLSMIFSRSIHVVANGSISTFLRLNSIPLYIYTPHLLYPIFYHRTLWLFPCLDQSD